MIPTLLRRSREPLSKVTSTILKAAEASAPTAHIPNPHRAHTTWPPDFERMSPQQQLRLEKKYKRRLQLAHRRPRWDKGVQYAQMFTVMLALVYLLFYAEFDWWGQKYKPHEEIKKSMDTLFGTMDEEKRHERRRDAPPPPPSSASKEA